MTNPHAFTETDIREAFECGAAYALVGTIFPDDHFDAAVTYPRWRQSMADIWGPVHPDDVGQTPDSEGWWWLRPAGCTDRPVYVHNPPGEAPGVMGDGKLVSVNKWPPSYWRGRIAGAK